MTFDELAVSRAAVLSGFGIGFFFEQDVIADIKDGRLVRLLADWTPPFPGLCLYYPGRRQPSAGLPAFLAFDLGRASRRDGVCHYVWHWVVADALKPIEE